MRGIQGVLVWRLLFLLGSIVIAMTVLYLYDIPWEPLLYVGGLCLLWSMAFLIYDWRECGRRRPILMKATGKRQIVSEVLPPPRYPYEREYQALIRKMESEHREEREQQEVFRTDLMNYYMMWAHQIKTPIAAMRLLLQQQDVAVGELTEELFKVEQYTEMALQYLRLEEMANDMLIQNYDLDTIVRGCIKKYSRMFIRRKLRLVYQPMAVSVLTDDKWLSFVIEQILSNALKYTMQGEIRIYMDESKEKTLVIEDTGIGIAQEDLPRITEKGFTGYNGRTDKRSTGIGLYLCQKVCRRLSHAMIISSRINEGTRVALDLSSYQGMIAD